MKLSRYGNEESLNVFDLIGAFQKMLERKRLKAPLTASITKTEQSVGEKMDEIMAKLERNGGSCDFYSLFDEGDTAELVMTFMSLLELMIRQTLLLNKITILIRLTVSFGREDRFKWKCMNDY